MAIGFIPTRDGGRKARLASRCCAREGAKVYAASFSSNPDGKFLAVGSDDKTQTACILATPEGGAGEWPVVVHHHRKHLRPPGNRPFFLGP